MAGGFKDNERAKRMKIFLDKMAECGQIGFAASAAGVTRSSVYMWAEKYPEFRKLFEQAKQIATGLIEDEAFRRAVEGTDRPLISKGEIVTTVKDYSDTLAIFLLKSNNPEKYRERGSLEITGAGGEPLSITDDSDRALALSKLLGLAQARKESRILEGELVDEYDEPEQQEQQKPSLMQQLVDPEDDEEEDIIDGYADPLVP